MNDPAKAWEEFLDPTILRPKLISASLFLAAYEILKDSVIDRIKSFYFIGFDESGWKIDPKYKSDVLSRNTSPLYASLGWLQENDAIAESDISTFDKIRNCRNSLAHELAKITTGTMASDHIALFAELVALLRKIETWWIVNVEIPLNEDFADVEIDVEGIVPGPVITVQLMLNIALGSDTEAAQYLDAYRSARKS